MAQPSLTSVVEGSEWLASHPGHFTPEESRRYPLYEEAGWASGTMWIMWSTENSSSLYGKSNRCYPDRSLSLYRLSHPANSMDGWAHINNIPIRRFISPTLF
jgi:hypothetical protein